MPDYRRADLDGADGGLAVSRVGVELVYSLPLAGGLLSLEFEQEDSAYRSDDSIFAGAGRADVAAIAIGAGYRRRVAAWRWFVGARLIDAVAEQAEFGEGGYAELSVGGLYAVNEGLLVGLMINGRGGIEADAEASLIPLIEYRIDARNRIGLVRSVEPAIGYSHRFPGGNELYFGAHLATRQFRIDDRSAAVDRERGWRVGGIFRNRRGFATEVFTGLVTRELDFRGDGPGLVDSGVERTPLLGLAASFRF